ncbi:MAG TPA: tRNA lysidine(34) synthetase TilS [Candidatus Limnocylindria bacterium]
MASSAPRTIVAKVRDYARQYELLRPGPLVVAVSGGTDSTALALILAELRQEFGLDLHVAHFDHRARPRAAAADAKFVGDLANHIEATLRIGRADGAPRNEDDARRARYEFLRRVAAAVGATAIATGHTKDDQAETVLLHIARGAGLAGLSGMRPERDGIVRPLLPLRRADTAATCRAAKIKPREDPTNRALRFARNRVRHRVLPELAKLNPEVTDAIARLAEAAASVADDDHDRADQVLTEATDGDALLLDRLPTVVSARERALALWWRERTGRTLGARHRAALGGLASDACGSKALDLPGGRVVREYGRLRTDVETPARVDGPVALARGQVVEWYGWRIGLDAQVEGNETEIAHVDTDVADKLAVRSRRPGDRMAGPRGRKVQDVFTDAKVPARQRDMWPLVTTGEDVLWIPHLTPAPREGRVALEVRRIVEEPT